MLFSKKEKVSRMCEWQDRVANVRVHGTEHFPGSSLSFCCRQDRPG